MQLGVKVMVVPLLCTSQECHGQDCYISDLYLSKKCRNVQNVNHIFIIICSCAIKFIFKNLLKHLLLVYSMYHLPLNAPPKSPKDFQDEHNRGC